MNRILGMALLAAVAAAPVALEAQTPGAGAVQEQALRQRGQLPLARLLQHRAELNLTDDQVSRLQAIQQRVEAQNAPLREQLRASGAFQRKDGEARGERRKLTPEQREQMRQRREAMTPEQREAFRQQMRERQGGEAGRRGPGARGQRQLPEELRPVMQQVMANSRAAMEEARGVLTAEQQSRLRELMQQRRGPAGERSGQARGARGTRGSN